RFFALTPASGMLEYVWPERTGPQEHPMLITHVMIHVKPEHVEAFKAATLENARNSVREPGIARFDVIQQADDPTRFVLVEVYRSREDTMRHKETLHYVRWRDKVASMMAVPRSSIKYMNAFPPDETF